MKYLLIALFIISFAGSAMADEIHCGARMLLDGADSLMYYSFDTTRHWTAVIKPFSNSYRVIVDGKPGAAYTDVTVPVFSPNAESWSYFATDNTAVHLVSEDTIIDFPSSVIPSDVVYSPDGESRAYSYIDNAYETIIYGTRQVQTNRRYGSIYINNGASMYAFVVKNGSRVSLNINGHETIDFDTIVPFGFWHDNKFVYAAASGYKWVIYKNDEELTEQFESVSSPLLNRSGTVAAAIVARTRSVATYVLISDQYTEPLYGGFFDSAYGLKLHPELALVAYIGIDHGSRYVCMNTAEYPGAEDLTEPFFTHDGSDMYYFGCGIDCFAVVNGIKTSLMTDVVLDRQYARKPGGDSFAYATASTLVVRYIQNPDLRSGKLMDETSPARYNRFADRYECLGRIDNKLYLLFCKE